MVKRTMNFKELLMVSRILSEIDIQSEIKYILSKDFDVSKYSENERNVIISAEIITFICSNIWKCGECFAELLASYTSKTIDEIVILDADSIVESLQAMFIDGLPKMIKNILKVDDIKKKISTDKKKV